MLSLVQRALRNLLVGDDEVVPACGCSGADGVAEPTSPLAPLFGGPSQRSEFNDPGGRSPLPLCQAAPTPPSAGGSPPAERRTRPSSQPPRHPTRHLPSRLVTRLTYDTMTRRSGEYRGRSLGPRANPRPCQAAPTPPQPAEAHRPSGERGPRGRSLRGPRAIPPSHG